MPRMILLLLALVIGALVPRGGAVAQQIAVQVTGSSDRPVPGALLTVLDSTGKTVKRLLANMLGRANIPVPAGKYQIRADGIGYSGITSDWITVTGTETTRVSLALRATPFVLEELVVSANRPCDRVDAEPVITKVWAEARKGLLSTTLSTDTPPLLERVLFTRDLGLSDEVVSITADTVLTATKQPFTSADPSLLHKKGFIVPDGGGSSGKYHYYAPDAELLLSDQFVSDHCFTLAAPKKGVNDLLGVIFKPNKQRKRVPEVEGTLWLDPATSELQTLEFRYVNFTLPQGARRIGGKVTFNRIPTGEWIVSHWAIRVPRRQGSVLSGYRESGGSARPIAIMEGTLVDSATGVPIKGAVIATSDGTARARTADDGTFSLASRRGGQSDVVVEVPLLEALGVPGLTRTLTWPLIGEKLAATVQVPMYTLLRSLGCPSMPADSPLGMLVAEARDAAGKRLGVSSFTIQAGDSVIANGSAVDGLLWGCSLTVGESYLIKAQVQGAEVTHRATIPPSKVAIVELVARKR